MIKQGQVPTTTIEAGQEEGADANKASNNVLRSDTLFDRNLHEEMEILASCKLEKKRDSASSFYPKSNKKSHFFKAITRDRQNEVFKKVTGG